MENPEEILQSLEEFSKMKPKDIPRELEEYLCFVAKTGNPVYQWQTIKSLFREKLLSVITEFYESCSSVEITPCPNVEMFNYDLMKNFILEKLDTFASAPFTVQRICELLTTPRKEYSRIDKYMRALEKNILVVSTVEPGRRSTENGEGILNGIESEHLPESSNSSHDINVEEMDESPSWPRTVQMAPILFESTNTEDQSSNVQQVSEDQTLQNRPDMKVEDTSSSTETTKKSQEENQQETVISCSAAYISIEPVGLNTCTATRLVITKVLPDAVISMADLYQRSLEVVETLENKSVAESEIEETLPENDNRNPPEKEEQTLTKSILSPTIIIERVEASQDSEIDTQSEKTVIPQPEPSSSSIEILMNINLQKEQNQVESCTEKLDEKGETGNKKLILPEINLEEEKLSKIEDESEQCALSNTSLKKKEEEIIASTKSEPTSSNYNQQTGVPMVKEKTDICIRECSSDVSEESKTIIKEMEPELSGEQACAPMDIEILQDTEVEEKEKPSSEKL